MTSFDDKRSSEKLTRKVLGDPTLYPDEFKAWLPRWLQANINFRVEATQLPQVENWKEVGATGSPAFVGAWTNYGGGHSTAAFYKDPFGRVHLKGLVQLGTIGTTIFILPAGYRPELKELFAVSGAAATNLIDVLPDGSVTSRSGSSSWLSLSGISFRAYA